MRELKEGRVDRFTTEHRHHHKDGSSDAVLRAADAALYEAKRAGRNGFRVSL